MLFVSFALTTGIATNHIVEPVDEPLATSDQQPQEQCTGMTADTTSEPSSDPVLNKADEGSPSENTHIDDSHSDDTKNEEPLIEPVSDKNDDGVATVEMSQEVDNETSTADMSSDSITIEVSSLCWLSFLFSFNEVDRRIRLFSKKRHANNNIDCSRCCFR